ncbi:MAG: exodeoxyribonuclease V subunit alpha [Pseudomonadota bacterium]
MSRHHALEHHESLETLLDAWVEAGWLRPIDRAVAAFLRRHVPDSPPLATLAAVLASHQGGGGHVCLDLVEVLERPDLTLRMPPADPLRPGPVGAPAPREVLDGLSIDDWRQALRGHPAVSVVAWPDAVGANESGRPLILVDDERPQVYLRRFWRIEERVATGLARRTGGDTPASPETIRPVLEALYPSATRPGDGTDWQKVACALAIRQPFTVVTGGPGTGKTTTVVRLLAALLSLQPPDASRASRIALCAPTGKAAARLAESIGDKVREIAGLPDTGFSAGHWSAIAAQLPTDVRTIHRLIGTRPLAERPRHHRENPLDLDIVVVDEASMVGLELMAQLVDALPAHARLVLLGDKDQLASVEAGAVLGELCRAAETGGYPAPLAGWLHEASGEIVGSAKTSDPLAAHIAMLRHSHRFGHDSAIGRLARAVNAGASDEAIGELDRPRATITDRAVRWLETPLASPARESALAELVLAGIRPWIEAIRSGEGFDPDSTDDETRLAAIFRQHNGFQLLCALRRGPSGVEGLNATIERWLDQAGLIDLPTGHRPGGWYAGRPIIVTRNDPQLGLANGDMGLTVPMRTTEGETVLRVVFPAAADEAQGRAWHWISPARLADAETAHALTVHKSQGSEFDHVALVLPERPNPILTRELIYTGITRARSRFTLVSPPGGRRAPPATEVLGQAIATTTRRSGNLRRRMIDAMDRQ